MRRISLALTLVGALAAAGCGGAGNSSGSGRAKGIPGVSFAVAVQTTAGGRVESGQLVGGVFTADGEINCAPASGTQTCSALFPIAESIFLRATANAPTATANRFYFEGFAGDCANGGICELTPGADKFVSASFTLNPTAHANWTDVAYGVKAHGVNLRCQNCHGDLFQGGGIAPNCNYCHKVEGTENYTLNVNGHFDPANEAWGPHGAVGTSSAWGQSCQRCHTGEGFRDYVGELDNSDNHLNGAFMSSNPAPTTGDNVSQAGSYKWGALGCNTCHNEVTDPMSGTHFNAANPAQPFDLEVYFGFTGPVAGVTSIGFPSLLQVSGVAKVTGLCGQCHQGRESTASIDNRMASGVAAASRGQGFGSMVAGAYTGTNPNTTTVLTGPKAAMAVDQLKGYTAIFNGASNKALNGVRAVVASNTAGVANTTAYTVTFAAALPSIPTCTTFVTSATPACDGATLYPTATGGTGGGMTGTLVDANRAWTVNKFVNYALYFQTGANAGKYAVITANDATSLTWADGMLAAPAAGDFYLIVPNTSAILDAVASGITSFTNPHYFGAAATIFGGSAAGWYQYPGYTYNVTDLHRATNCTDCHGAHANKGLAYGVDLGGFEVEDASCESCHGVGHDKAFQAAKTTYGDMDGDATIEGTEVEIEGLEATFYAAIQQYSKLASGDQLCYKDAYPYMYVDADADGVCEDTETTSYSKYTPRLARAAFNLKWSHTESGAWAHNPIYTAQVLMDAIDDVKAGITAKGGSFAGGHGARP